MGLREYMKEHQKCKIFSIHFIVMWLILWLYVLDYNLNEDYYNDNKE